MEVRTSKEVIDLTADPDDSAEPSMPRERLKSAHYIQTPVPLPENVRNLSRSSLSQSTPTSTLRAPIATPSMPIYSNSPVPLPSVNHSWKSGIAGPDARINRKSVVLHGGADRSGSRKSADQRFAPVHKGQSSTGREEKRRRLGQPAWKQNRLPSNAPEHTQDSDEGIPTSFGTTKSSLGGSDTPNERTLGSIPDAPLVRKPDNRFPPVDIGSKDGLSTPELEIFQCGTQKLHIGSTTNSPGVGLGCYPPGGVEPNISEAQDVLRSFGARQSPRRKSSEAPAPVHHEIQNTRLTPERPFSICMERNETEEPMSSPLTHEKGLKQAEALSRNALSQSKCKDISSISTPSAGSALSIVHPSNPSVRANGHYTHRSRTPITRSSAQPITHAVPPLKTDSHSDEFIGKGNKYSQEEDDMIIYLKEVKGLTWTQIGQQVPGRTSHTVQSRYSRVLNNRKNKTSNRFSEPDPHTQLLDNDGMDLTYSDSDTYLTPLTRQERDQSSSGVAIPRVIRALRSDGDARASRPRRSVGIVDYNVRRSLYMKVPEEFFEEEVGMRNSRSTPTWVRSDEASKEPPSDVSFDAALLISRPMSMDIEDGVAKIAINLSKPRKNAGRCERYPYLSCTEREFLRNGSGCDWDPSSSRDLQGTVLHVDFQPDELEVIEHVATKVLPSPHPFVSGPVSRRLQRLLRHLPENKILQISYEVTQRLGTRDLESLNAFLQDAARGRLASKPRIERAAAVKPVRAFDSSSRQSTTSLIRQRQLGLQSKRGWRGPSTTISYESRNTFYDTLGPVYKYTGASSDVHTVAWSPNGEYFAAGAICVTDSHSMQYNRPNNLLFGVIPDKALYELPNHNIRRKKTESGANSTHSMHVSQDPRLFTTVTMVDFSPDGQYMFSAGWDKHVRIWNTPNPDNPTPQLVKRLKHKAEVEMIRVNRHGVLATAGRRSNQNAIKLVRIPENIDELTFTSFTSQKAIQRADLNILPQALQFEPNFGRLLLAGFGANSREDRLDNNGEICLWDIETESPLVIHGNTRNVFDVAFNPRNVEAPYFAVGCVAGQNVNRGSRSVVRFYDCRAPGKYGMIMEVECPALDMNDVAYCPYDDLYFAAGCTDGSTYIWDVRRPDTFMYKLSHGKSLQPLDEDQDIETTDTGVKFCSWGNNATRLYTGSSDGVIKVWDIARSPTDVFIKDLVTIDSGVMAGSFSPDQTSLLIGEVNGSINVLEVGREDNFVKDAEALQYIPAAAQLDDDDYGQTPSAQQNADSGIAAASELIQSGQIEIAPFGGLPIRQAVRGPSYIGPYDLSPDAIVLREQAQSFQRNLVSSHGPQCDIPSCRDNRANITSEEAGDSGRSADRIPDTLRREWMNIGTKPTVIPGKARCACCGRPARPIDTTANADAAPFCERCAFECFRCGSFDTRIDPQTKLLHCTNCKCGWSIGVLGYECLQPRGGGLDCRDVPVLSSSYSVDEDGDGDEMNALTDYYQSLWIDRPPSPPL